MNRTDRTGTLPLHRRSARYHAITRELSAMYNQYPLARVIHAERLARGIAERQAERFARQHPPSRPIRQAIGRSMIRIGARLAAESNLRPARFR
jgi:hypothetical protein